MVAKRIIDVDTTDRADGKVPVWSAADGTHVYVPSSGAVATDAIWDAKGDLPVGTGADTAAKLSVGANGTVPIAASGEATGIKWGTPPGMLLATKVEAGSHTYSTSSATLADVDAANMAVTFIAPASGSVLVRLSALCDSGAGTAGQFFVWGCREGTTNLGGEAAAMRAPDTSGHYISVCLIFTGLSAGSHTFKWSFAMSQAAAATGRLLVGAGGAGSSPPATMEVWAM